MVSTLDDAKRFKTACKVSTFAGVVPRQFQSGNLDRKGRVTRRGPALLRKVLVEAAGYCKATTFPASTTKRIPKWSKWSGKMKSAALPTTCYWSSKPRSGCRRTAVRHLPFASVWNYESLLSDDPPLAVRLGYEGPNDGRVPQYGAR
jgi:hypothetical protein